MKPNIDISMHTLENNTVKVRVTPGSKNCQEKPVNIRASTAKIRGSPVKIGEHLGTIDRF